METYLAIVHFMVTVAMDFPQKVAKQRKRAPKEWHVRKVQVGEIS